ncbi:MAG: hypothetical protein IKT67_07100 [Lachnospiraceae bacterium]|nr:hypothetical protein [Lachnospiraceae bacterium]
MDKREYTVGEIILGIVFAIWFFASIVAFLLCARTSGWLALAVIGQYFFVFGLVALVNGLKNRDFKPIFLIFLYAGAATLCGGLIMQYGGEALQEKFKELIPYIALSGFLVVGILCFCNALVRNRRNQNCTQPVKATCISVKRRRSQTTDFDDVGKHMRYLMCPVFRFYYRGRKYEVSHNTFTRYCEAEEGAVYELYINPDHPRCFREEGEDIRLNGMELTIGVFFTVFSIGVMILVKVLG